MFLDKTLISFFEKIGNLKFKLLSEKLTAFSS